MAGAGSDRPAAHAAIVLPCADLAATQAFFVDRLGFRLERISPADDPRVAVLVGHGLRVELARDATGDPGTIRLRTDAPADLPDRAPNGTRILVDPLDPPLVLPPLRPELVVHRASPHGWIVGRAGMAYQDLLPGRLGGRFIASRIRIADEGPVPDLVHWHRVRFQLIGCLRGRVRVVYEDQGPPFELAPGDCVVQPPGIRHRVLWASAGLEVLEIGCPAAHDTLADPDLSLPTAEVRAGRAWDGQRFTRHVAADAPWTPWLPGFRQRAGGIAAATGGLGELRAIRPDAAGATADLVHDGELRFWFVDTGRATLTTPDRTDALGPGDSVAIPAGLPHRLRADTDDLALIEVAVPGRVS